MRHTFQPAFIVLLLAMLVGPVRAQIGPEHVAPADAPATIAIVDKKEPGERFIVTGRVTAADGKTPIFGASVYVYHTDASGHYDPNESQGRQGPPRLKGFLRTDKAGRYTYDTIRPAPYPGREIPAHVHYGVAAPGYEDRWLELRFTDDPILKESDRVYMAKHPDNDPLCAPTKDAKGAWRCTVDILLTRK